MNSLAVNDTSSCDRWWRGDGTTSLIRILGGQADPDSGRKTPSAGELNAVNQSLHYTGCTVSRIISHAVKNFLQMYSTVFTVLSTMYKIHACFEMTCAFFTIL